MYVALSFTMATRLDDSPEHNMPNTFLSIHLSFRRNLHINSEFLGALKGTDRTM